jgi:hypothetical protein
MKNNLNSFHLKSSLIICFLLLNIVFKSSPLFLKSFEHIDAVAIPDDAYLSLNIARNIAEGKGPLYSENFTNGFQPLYVFLSVPFYIMFGEDKFITVYLALAMLIIFDCLCLFILMKIVNLFTQNIFPVLLVAVFWITSPYVMLTTLNGLETIISFFFIVTSFYYFYKHRENLTAVKNLLVLGVLCGLAMFARIDNGFLAPVIFIFILSDSINNSCKFKIILKSLLIFSVSAILTVSPWFIYSYIHTGDLIQGSGEAVRYQNMSLFGHFPFFSKEQLEIILYGFRIVFIKNFSLWLLIGICLILLMIKFRKVDFKFLKERLTAFLPVFIFCLILFSSYVFYIYGMWFFKRYLFPVVFLFMIILAIFFDALLKTYSLPGSKNGIDFRKFFIAGAFLLLILVNVTRFDFKELFLSSKTSGGYYPVGKWVSENVEGRRLDSLNGTVIGSLQTGAMGYFAGDKLKVINLDGVVNKEALLYAKNKNLIDYIKKKKIEYIANWNINQDFVISESENLKENDVIYLYTIEDFKTWGWEWNVYRVNYDE